MHVFMISALLILLASRDVLHVHHTEILYSHTTHNNNRGLLSSRLTDIIIASRESSLLVTVKPGHTVCHPDVL